MNSNISENNKTYILKELMSEIEFETYQYSLNLSLLAEAKAQKMKELNITNKKRSRIIDNKYLRLILNKEELGDLLLKPIPKTKK